MTADQVVRTYYDNYNAGRFEEALKYIADDVEYHDMIYDKPFKGKELVIEYLTHVKGKIPGLQFVIDETTQNDKYRVGCIWHVELNGKQFPFSRGSSYYKVNDKGQISYGRDIAEPSMKTGASVFPLLQLVSWVIRKFNITPRPTEIKTSAIIWWTVYAAYMYHILFDPDAPGKNVTDMAFTDLKPTIDLSLNVYFINDLLHKVGINTVNVVHYNPVQESVFNTVLLWAFAFLPFMLSDEKSKGMKKTIWWLGGWFITNVVYFPFFALRAARDTELFDFQLTERSRKLPKWSPIFGTLCLGLMIFFIYHGFYGGSQSLEQRKEAYLQLFWNDRIFYAFNWDYVLFYVWQFVICEMPFYYQVIPFFGPVLYMFLGPKKDTSAQYK